MDCTNMHSDQILESATLQPSILCTRCVCVCVCVCVCCVCVCVYSGGKGGEREREERLCGHAGSGTEAHRSTKKGWLANTGMCRGLPPTYSPPSHPASAHSPVSS